MDKLEAAAIGEKSWLLKGEAGAKERPMNSALETDLEFEHVMAPAPVISAEITQKLEDIIKQRIIEGRFDDVERVDGVGDGEREERVGRRVRHVVPDATSDGFSRRVAEGAVAGRAGLGEHDVRGDDGAELAEVALGVAARADVEGSMVDASRGPARGRGGEPEA